MSLYNMATAASASSSQKKLPKIFKHYDLPDDVTGTFKVKCRHCPVGYISGVAKVTTNVLKHVRVSINFWQRQTCHSYSCVHFHQSQHPPVDLSVKPRNKRNEPEQPTLHSFMPPVKKYTPSDPRQRKLTDAVVSFVIGDLQPLRVVESDCFQDVLYQADPRFVMPSRKHLSYYLLLRGMLLFLPRSCQTWNPQASCYC